MRFVSIGQIWRVSSVFVQMKKTWFPRAKRQIDFCSSNINLVEASMQAIQVSNYFLQKVIITRVFSMDSRILYLLFDHVSEQYLLWQNESQFQKIDFYGVCLQYYSRKINLLVYFVVKRILNSSQKRMKSFMEYWNRCCCKSFHDPWIRWRPATENSPFPKTEKNCLPLANSLIKWWKRSEWGGGEKTLLQERLELSTLAYLKFSFR
jgi:hypothetical protein